jgi:translation initiation factor 3 subunit C
MNEAIAKQKVSTKKMNATSARGLNAMKQKIRRNNKDYAAEIEKYREDKFDYMVSEEEEEVAPVEKKRARKETHAQDLEEGDEAGFSTVGRGGRTLQYTPESILAHLRTINESRGKKNTDRAEQIRIMERLLAVAMTPYQRIRILLSLISTRFDLTTGSASNYMSQEQWRQYGTPFRFYLRFC